MGCLKWIRSPRSPRHFVILKVSRSSTPALCRPRLLNYRIGREAGVPGPSRGSASRGTRGPSGVRRGGGAQVPPSAPPIPPEPGRAGAPTAEARAGGRGVTAPLPPADPMAGSLVLPPGRPLGPRHLPPQFPLGPRAGGRALSWVAAARGPLPAAPSKPRTHSPATTTR